MWKYQHPEFALFLLGELQKQQQQGSIFCDVLLQSEGVCVPAHSCVLAALSPVFYRTLSSPALQAGQNRLLNLEPVRPHALLKLVAFLYSGEMELESHTEHEGVMAAAFRLGLKSVFEKRGLVERGFLDAGKQPRDTGIKKNNMTGQESETGSEAKKAASVQTCGLISELTQKSIESVPNLHNKTKRRWKMTKKKGQFKRLTRQQTKSKLRDLAGTDSNQPGLMERSHKVSGKDFQKLLKKDNIHHSDNTDPEALTMDQFKVRIKLRRRRGAYWESNLHVSLQGEAEMNSEDVQKREAQIRKSDCGSRPVLSLGTLTPPTDQTVSPSNSYTNVSSDKGLDSTHHVSVPTTLDVPALSSSPLPVEESDEQIAMLLDDMFMMGLNILPLMPLDRNLDEAEHFIPPQEHKGGQREPQVSLQGAFHLVQTGEPEMRDFEAHETKTQDGSCGQSEKVVDEEQFDVVSAEVMSLDVDNILMSYCSSTLSENGSYVCAEVLSGQEAASGGSVEVDNAGD
ncbi:hypothetical protein DNTS_001216 [Danionella cerebrum]|uniref:BTB domain-containing protein n=1 Tax=Danionella cerebrum TaxID=2873325 RepID=A0A553Q448_9TELE|nr:hypothetical protein DNTS_001216 [Danionella translucida]